MRCLLSLSFPLALAGVPYLAAFNQGRRFARWRQSCSSAIFPSRRQKRTCASCLRRRGPWRPCGSSPTSSRAGRAGSVSSRWRRKKRPRKRSRCSTGGSSAIATWSWTRRAHSPSVAPAAVVARVAAAVGGRAAVRAAEAAGGASRVIEERAVPLSRGMGHGYGGHFGAPIYLEQAELRRLRCLIHIRDEPVLLGEAAEALPGLEHLRLVVLHVLVGARRVPRARQLRGLVDGHARRAPGDVVGDLIAGLDGPAARHGQLVCGRRGPQARGQALAVDFE